MTPSASSASAGGTAGVFLQQASAVGPSTPPEQQDEPEDSTVEREHSSSQLFPIECTRGLSEDRWFDVTEADLPCSVTSSEKDLPCTRTVSDFVKVVYRKAAESMKEEGHLVEPEAMQLVLGNGTAFKFEDLMLMTSKSQQRQDHFLTRRFFGVEEASSSSCSCKIVVVDDEEPFKTVMTFIHNKLAERGWAENSGYDYEDSDDERGVRHKSWLRRFVRYTVERSS